MRDTTNTNNTQSHKYTVEKDLDLSDVQEDPELIELVYKRNKDMQDLLADLEVLGDIMVDINIILAKQDSQLKVVATNIVNASNNINTGIIELKETEVIQSTNRGLISNVIGMISGGGVGTLGFIAHPIIGIVTTLVGSVSGWFVAKGVNKVIDSH